MYKKNGGKCIGSEWQIRNSPTFGGVLFLIV